VFPQPLWLFKNLPRSLFAAHSVHPTHTMKINPTLATTKTPLKGLLPEELVEYCRSIGEPKYRATQIFRRLYAEDATVRAASFDAMTELPVSLRRRLEETADMSALELARVQESSDGTKKFLFRLVDGREIETVLIPSESVEENGEPKRLTLCVSTQVGCPLNCQFCATASLKLKRNLTAGEIVDQFLTAQQYSDKPITNLVFMGMGEPMLNYDNVMKAVQIFTHADAQLLGARRITISTSGLVEGIMRLADEQSMIKLALSLHATTDGLRTKLMPINKKYNLQRLGNALEYYYRKTGSPITYEYILFDGINDSDEDARRLQRITRRVPSKVNVIPFHPIDFTNPEGIAASLKPTSPEAFQSFIQRLRDLDVTVMIRSSSGKDIHAACGQLALSNMA
jgi:23S rRNA (adenine2503-C2)-methyltransferase